MINALHRYIENLLQRLSGKGMIDDILGDLNETYHINRQSKGTLKAEWLYMRDAISLFGSYGLKHRKYQARPHFLSTQNTIPMFANYFKVAYRNLIKSRFFTFMNVAGLAVGMSVSLLFLAVIADVLDYDSFHTKGDRIYRVITRLEESGEVNEYASTPQITSEFLKSFPGIEQIVRMDAKLGGEVAHEEKYIPMEGFFADPSFFEVFNFKMLQGNRNSINVPNALLITESAATRLFSEVDPMGKTVSIEPYGDFIISGIMEDHPKKSHLQFDIIAPFQRIENISSTFLFPDSEAFRDHYVYFLTSEKFDERSLEDGLAAFSKEHTQKDSPASLSIQSLSEMNLGRELRNSPGPQWDKISMIIFGVLSILILVPACLNYANLSIARALQRAREIGVRKVVGGNRRQIFMQFIIEAMLVFIIAFILAFVGYTYMKSEFLAILAGPSAAGLSLELSATMIIIFILFILIIGFLIGVIPALHFSRLQPLSALKNASAQTSKSRLPIRRILLATQFTLSIGFIFAVFIILDQYRFTLNYEYGFNKENILNVNLQDIRPSQWEQSVGSLAGVQNLSFTSDIIGAAQPYETYAKISDTDSLNVQTMYVNDDFLSMHGLALVSGQNFSNRTDDYELEILVNESFIKQAGFASASDILGQPVITSDQQELIVRGVVKDFNFNQIKYEIRPLILRNNPDDFRFAAMQVSTNDMLDLREQLEAKWEELSDRTFEANLLSDELEETYYWYQNMIRMIAFLGLLATSVSCLGLLGMVVFHVARRTKEVGIRKIHGASSATIVYLLSREFLWIMVISCFIGIPVTYALFNSILPMIQHYSAQIGVLPIIASVLLLFLIGGATVASQTISAARQNPADVLKYE